MKILVLSNKMPFPPRDGGSIATFNMLLGLEKAGNELTCMALNTSKHYFPVEDIPGKYADHIRILSTPCNTRIRPLAMLSNLLFSRKPYIAKRFESKEFRKALLQILENEHFDLIQMEGPYLAYYADLLQEKSSALLSFRAHNVEHKIWKRKAAHEKCPVIRWYLHKLSERIRKLETELASRADCVLPISQVDARFFAQVGLTDKIKVVPAGLRLDHYPFPEPAMEPSCFFIGALDWLPNQEGLKWFLDSVYPLLKNDFPGLCFHVAGRNAPSSISRMLDQEGIRYYGEVEDAKAFMQEQSIMVAPLLTGSGIRIKILEAMAMGKPVLTTPVGIEGIPAADGKEVCIAESPEQFASGLRSLLADKALRNRLRMNGKKLVQENFDTFELSKQLTVFFQNLR